MGCVCEQGNKSIIPIFGLHSIHFHSPIIDRTMFNPMELMGKLREVQAEMERVKQRLDGITLTSETGGGMVRVTANANRKILKIEVDPDIIDKNDKEMMEDLIVAAVNKVMEEAENLSRQEISKVSSGMLPNMPGLDPTKL